MSTTPIQLIAPSEAARRLGVHPRTIHRWIEAGILVGYHVGPHRVKVDPKDIEALVTRIEPGS